MTINKLAPLIESRLPSYVHDQYPVFVSFITSYFEWLDETDNFSYFLNEYKANIDIDQSNDNFVEQFLQEFVGGIPSNNLKIPKNDLVKLIREFYISKGTEESFKFIFRVLYNQDVNVYYPRELMFATSDNTYDGDFIMSVTKSQNKEYFINENSIIYITDNTSNYKAIVDELKEKVDVLGHRYFQAFLSSYDDGIFSQQNMDLKLEIDGVVYNTSIVESINDIEIQDGGKGYDIGDDVYIDRDLTNANSGMFGKVSAVTNGGIESISINNAGDNYIAGDFIGVQQSTSTKGYGFSGRVLEVDVNGSIIKAEIVSKGFNFEDVQIGYVTSNRSGIEPTTQASFVLDGSKLGSIKRIQIKDGGHIHDNTSINILTTGGTGSVLNPIFTNIFETPKYTTNQKGFTSFNNVLTDSLYYQQFSYLVSSYEPPNEWKYIVNQILHPAGLVQFNNWLYESESGDDDIIGFTDSENIDTLVILIISEMMDRFLISVESTTSQTEFISSAQFSMLGHNLRDLDNEKTLVNFNYPASLFYDFSIHDILTGKNIEFNYMNESYITQTTV